MNLQDLQTAVVGEYVYLFGGHDGSSYVGSVYRTYIYNPVLWWMPKFSVVRKEFGEQFLQNRVMVTNRCDDCGRPFEDYVHSLFCADCRVDGLTTTSGEVDLVDMFK